MGEVNYGWNFFKPLRRAHYDSLRRGSFSIGAGGRCLYKETGQGGTLAAHDGRTDFGAMGKEG